VGKRNNPMKAKVFMANAREFRAYTRELRDDGVQRRTDREALTAADVREKSRERKAAVTRGELIRLELSRRAYMRPEQRAVRTRFVGSARQAVK